MSKFLEKQAFVLLERIANASGRTIDTAYASLVHKLGLTEPFFKVGSIIAFTAAIQAREGSKYF